LRKPPPSLPVGRRRRLTPALPVREGEKRRTLPEGRRTKIEKKDN